MIQNLEVKRLNENATVPTKGTDNSAGYDLYASEDGTIPPQSRAIVPTGISIALPTLFKPFKVYGSIRPRSGLAARNGIDTGAGVIDADYRGEIKVVLFNHNTKEYSYRRGDRIAQLILEVHINREICIVDELTQLSNNERGVNGFGSTGN